MVEATGSVPGTPQRSSLNASSKTLSASSLAVSSGTASKRNPTKSQSTASVPFINKLDVIPVIVPRSNMRLEQGAESRKEIGTAGRTMPFSLQSKATDFQKLPNSRDDVDKPIISVLPDSTGSKAAVLGSGVEMNVFPAVKSTIQGISIVDKSMKDDWFIGSGKHEMDLRTEPVVTSHHGSCMYFNILNHHFQLFGLYIVFRCLLVQNH